MTIAKAQPKLDRRVARTRKAIMEAFDKLILDYGLDKLTVSAIAREADIDRKTFYLHYSSIDDLANHKAEAGIERVVAVVCENNAKTFEELVHAALSEVNNILMEDLDICSHLASSMSIDQIVSRIAQAIEYSRNRNGIDIDLAEYLDSRSLMTLHFYIAGALSLYATWLKTDHSLPIEEVSRAIEGNINFGSEQAKHLKEVSAFLQSTHLSE